MIPAGQFLYVSNPLGKVRSLRSQRLRGRPSGRMGSAPATGAADCALAVCSLPPPSGAFSIQFSVISRSPPGQAGRVCPRRAKAADLGQIRPTFSELITEY